jgi:hypothetical protein
VKDDGPLNHQGTKTPRERFQISEFSASSFVPWRLGGEKQKGPHGGGPWRKEEAWGSKPISSSSFSSLSPFSSLA